jgi:Uma2 family endonuclease
MSTVRRAPTKSSRPPLEAGQHLDQPTFHERYEAMPPETRAELVGGVVYMPSPMRLDHAETSWIVAGWLFHYARVTPGIRSGGGATIKLDRQGEPEPDSVLFVPAELGGQSQADPEGYLTGAPELIVEVARSSRTYDLRDKKVDYERAGVVEYLVVELIPNRVHWFRRSAKRLAALRPGPDGIYRSKVFPGLWLDPKALYAKDLDRLIHVLEEGLATPEHAAFVAKLAAAGPRRRSP